MKSTTFSFIPWLQAILLGMLLLGGAIPAKAIEPDGPEREFSKKILREFGTTANGMTAIYNKYGKVNVNTWGNNSVKIDITIIVNANDQRDADKAFDQIKVNFISTAGYVKAETIVEVDGGKWWPGNACQDFKINYDVWMPANNQLDLKNKYGNAYVASLNGKLLAEIKYGDLRTEAVNNDADLIVGYGKATMAKVRNLSGQISYGGLTLTEGSDIQLDSKYSGFQIDQANAVRVTSKYDDFSFGNIQEVRMQTKYANLRIQSARAAFVTAQYTDIKLGNVSETVDADLAYGSLRVDALARSFSEARIVGKYTDVQVNVERGAAFRFDAEGMHTDLQYPNGATIRRKNEQAGGQSAIEGFVGDANAPRFVKARLSYGDFVLR